MLKDVEQVTALDVEDDVLKSDAALRPELRVLRIVAVEVLHRSSVVTQCVRDRHTLASSPVCHGGRFLGYQAGIAVAVDAMWVIVFAANLFTTRGSPLEMMRGAAALDRMQGGNVTCGGNTLR
jgi:hypothetical protein